MLDSFPKRASRSTAPRRSPSKTGRANRFTDGTALVIKVWDLGRRKLELARRPLVMGILNVTPDSFSDGGKHADPRRAVDAALQMEADGADIIDIGGESTRPYSDPVGVAEELDRVLPVIERLAGKLSIPISIDTSKSAVAAAAVDAGAEIINDVTGLEGDPEMPAVARDRGVGVCVMHMQGTPQTMQENPQYDDVVQEIYDYLLARRDFCRAAGIRTRPNLPRPGHRVRQDALHTISNCCGPRDGFRKSARRCSIGHSRKGFIGKTAGGPTGRSDGSDARRVAGRRRGRCECASSP